MSTTPEAPLYVRNQLGDPLLTDQYTLTMTQSFWRHGQADELASFDLFVRRLPAERRYLVVAGLQQAVEYMLSLRFDPDDIDFLRSLGIYEEDYLSYLAQMRFTGSVEAVAEGTILGAQAPLLSITAPRAQASIIESALLAIINHQTMVASKASRIVDAADGAPVWDFSLRRLHGLGAALGVARAAFIAGCAGTATVAAGRELGIPTTGTMAHHYVQGFGPDNEQAAFEQFLRDYPDNGVLLVDTYDTLRGVCRAIAAGKATGIRPKALRLDSGDLAELSVKTRRLLDEAGYGETMILASNDLDEYKIADLRAAGAPINAFGVGTMLGTSADAPNLGGVYKLVAQEAGDERPELVMKLAPEKLTDPGHHQLWRTGGTDLLTLREESPPAADAEPLLQTVIRDGELVAELPTLEEAQRRCAAQRQALAPQYRELAPGGAQLTIKRSPLLEELRQKMAAGAAD